MNLKPTMDMQEEFLIEIQPRCPFLYHTNSNDTGAATNKMQLWRKFRGEQFEETCAGLLPLNTDNSTGNVLVNKQQQGFPLKPLLSSSQKQNRGKTNLSPRHFVIKVCAPALLWNCCSKLLLLVSWSPIVVRNLTKIATGLHTLFEFAI